MSDFTLIYIKVPEKQKKKKKASAFNLAAEDFRISRLPAVQSHFMLYFHQRVYSFHTCLFVGGLVCQQAYTELISMKPGWSAGQNRPNSG